MNLLAQVCSVHLEVEQSKLWDVLTLPEWTEQYMYNCRVITSLEPGAKIEWKGVFQGVETFLTGEILRVEPKHKLVYTTIDPTYSDATNPANYIHVTYELRPQNGGILFTVLNETYDGSEERLAHIKQGWEEMVFPKLKGLLT